MGTNVLEGLVAVPEDGNDRLPRNFGIHI